MKNNYATKLLKSEKSNSITKRMLLFSFAFLCTLTSFAQAPNPAVATNANNFTCTSFNANWEASACATTYFLDVSLDSAFTNFLTGYNNLNVGNVTTYLIAGFSPTSSYYYRVRASNNAGTSLNSNEINVYQPVTTPFVLAVSNITCTSLNLNWLKQVGATSYNINVSTDPFYGIGNVEIDTMIDGDLSTFNASGFGIGDTVYYRIKALNPCVTGQFTSSFYVFLSSSSCGLSAPSSVAANSVSCTSFDANWTEVVGATGYIIDVSTDSAFTTLVSGYDSLSIGNVLTYSITGLNSNTTYYYKVRSTDGTVVSESINTIAVSTHPCDASAPVLLSECGISCSSFNVTWLRYTGATSYYLDISTDASFATALSGFDSLNVGNVLTYNVTGLNTNTTYYYHVWAADGSVMSMSSDTMQITTAGMATVTATPSPLVVCSGGTTSIALSSNAVDATYSWVVLVQLGATGASSGSGSMIAQTLTPTGSLPGKVVYGISVSVNGCSGFSTTDTVTVDTAACVIPVVIAESAQDVTCTSFTAYWDSLSGTVSYYLDVSTDSMFNSFVGNYMNLNIGTDTLHSVTGLTMGTTYYYRVRSSDGTIISPNSNTISVVTSSIAINPPVANYPIYIGCGLFQANWHPVDFATGYIFQAALDSNFVNVLTGYDSLSVGNDTIYNVNALSPGQIIYYRVWAVATCGNSVASNVVSVQTANPPLAPTVLPISEVTCNSFVANWYSVNHTDYYYVYFSSDSTFSSVLLDTTLCGCMDSLLISGLDSSLTYYYTVSGFNGCFGSHSDTMAVELLCSTGVTEMANNSIQLDVYPNPAKDKLIIALDDKATTSARVVLIDMLGKKIKETELKANEIQTQLDLTDIPNGTYYLQFNQNDSVETRKIVVSK